MSARRTARVSESGSAQQKRAQWSTQAYKVDELLSQFSLPQIVKCQPLSILVKRDSSSMPVNLGQPILLFESRAVRKLLARNVVLDPLTGRFTENDDTVTIPNDYEGSFLRLRSRTSKDHTTHKTIESLANIKAFLNLSKMAAYRMVNPHNGVGEYPRLDYLPGNVFAVDTLLTGSAKLKQDGKFLVHKNSSSKDMKILKCRDDKDNPIIMPLSQSGEFVEIIPNDLNGSNRLSVNSAELVEKQTFPIVVRYIRGPFKPRLKSFTGLFTLLDSFEENTIVGCVLDKNGYTFMELPVCSPLTFHLALNFTELQGHPMVKNALRLCDTNGHNFARDLKFKFKFAQRTEQPETPDKPPDEADDPGESPSARNSIKGFGVTSTYIYI
ncbi:uncharacterized protein LOC127855270 [Dreissena polymorpha]|uniref:CABIT domain-containing protein n=1 Tax=Dreissena polymorpha TaxID=45954 RepID=A0A9D4CCK8_DREPO|nr:uncharacterized protein LOC127855270 [Dreissena polymorpha]KAH3721179.1 hypothetical protein DPMN_064097 [Dreissena polymorpha]